MIRAVATACLFALPAQSSAQDLDTSVALYRFFLTRCGAISAFPEGAVNKAFDQGNAQGSFTPDRSFVEYQQDIEGSPSGMLLHFTNRHPGGEFSTCAIHLFINESSTFTDLEAYLDRRADSFLGGSFIKTGGTLKKEDLLSLSHTWATQDFPPTASLNLFQNEQVIILRSNRLFTKQMAE